MVNNDDDHENGLQDRPPQNGRRRLASVSVFALGGLIAFGASSSHGEEMPVLRARPQRVLFLLADDLSWADLACYGHPWHETPHLDRLARQGMRFTHAYASAPICSASRASLLTGKTTARLHFEFVTKNEPGLQKLDAPTPIAAPPFTLNLPLREVTIAELLDSHNWETEFFGKWHLNAHYQRYLGWSPTHGPRQQGFATAVEDFGGHPYSWGKRTPEPTRVGEFPRDTMVERIVASLNVAMGADGAERGPRFTMASMFYVHTPVKTPCQWLLDKYDRKLPRDAGSRTAGSESQSAGIRERRVRYAAFVETLDHYVGQMLDAIPDSEREETLVVFTSDNGGHPEYTANGPLRGSKWNLYEGGIRVPLIARWPGAIRAGSKCEVSVVGYDLLPTFAACCGADVPSAVDGADLMPLLLDEKESLPTRDLIWHFPYYHPERGYRQAPEKIGVNDFVTSRTHPHSAIRRGRYKLLRFYDSDRVELYDLSNDPSESRDLSVAQANRSSQLATRLKTRLNEMNARFPIPHSDSALRQ